MPASSKEGSLVSDGSGGRSTEAKRKMSCADECVAKDDDCLLTLSLGSICSDPVNVASATSSASAAANLPPPAPSVGTLAPGFALGLTDSVVHANGGDGGSAFLAAAAGALTTASKLTPPFPNGGNGTFAVPVYNGSDVSPAHTPLTGFMPSSLATSAPMKGASAPAPPPKKRRRVTDRSNKASAAPSNDGGLSESSGQPSFPWAKKNRVAEHYSLAELAERGIGAIEGEVQCKRCNVRKTVALDVKAKFKDLHDFIARNVQAMDDRAPEEWKDPALPDCDGCGQKNSLRPVISAEKERINWMFLLLGQTLGLCTLDQLKHFCAHTHKHRTGAKDRVLYSTYMELCNQLCPGGPFDMAFKRNRNRPFA